ncbi:hypothetical protein Rhe02_92880 [Rhizocola hellebori]|uniref:DUF397 domain-containing protein n=1 Tax=Rhizocola hellebori TaxID=1392758 RepID=A0A8J3QIE2_9ACTN|nr:DUF397 domain-containing protein [Rhizocola hellebori]GIH11221.1 hypothetical protein Rhe02_92880 [Rhizocola hellebori]
MQHPEFTNWHKSNHSDDGGCVEIAYADGLIGVRDSKDPAGPILTFNRHEWNAFTAGIVDGTLTPEG